MNTLSVTSSTSADGASPVSASISATRGTNERLQLVDREVDADAEAVVGEQASCHAAVCRQASARTQAPIGTMSPVSSAIGMNTSGGSGPCSGCCQRSSASVPTSAPVSQVDDGLVGEAELALRRARRGGRPRAPAAARRPVPSPGRTTRQQFRPAAFAAYIARSAWRSRSSPPVPTPPAMPMLAAEPHLGPTERERGGEAGEYLVGDRRRRGEVAAREQDRELVAAEPGQHVGARGRRRGAGAATRVEQVVAGGVAEGVVDGLEAVEVEQQQDRLVGGGLVEPVGEAGAVGEAGERVAVGEDGELLRALLDAGLELAREASCSPTARAADARCRPRRG